MRYPPIELIIGILALFTLEQSSARRARGLTRLPVPTSETIPYVAEVMGAASYEETVEDEEPSPVKRVQRKLTNPEDTDKDLDPEQQEFAEYQGVMGRPGVDFPVLPSIPRTDFSCRKVKSSGYYADLDTGCQVFHICDGGRKISFLCPNGTIFRQSHLICDWWFRVDCERSVELYEESAEQLAHDQMIYKKRAEEIAKAMESKPTTTERISNFRANRRKNEQNFNNFNGKEQNYTSQASFNQEQTYKNTNRNSYQTNGIQTEKEGQVLAETASFASNRHRFGNQINQNYYQTSTKAPNAEGQNYQGNFQTQQTAQRYSTAASVQSTTLNRNNYNFNDFNKVNQYQTTRAQPQQNTQPNYQTTAKYQQNYNQYQSTSAPQYQTPSTQGATRNFNRQTFQPTNKPIVSTANQPVFNVKVKPNKEYSFVELHRQNEQTSASPVETTTAQYSLGPSTTYSPTVPHGSTQFAYIPTKSPSATTRYATYNSSGKTEEIRPEVVNSMFESGVTPTSAKALHSLASYISSAEVSDYSGESNRPQVSDVILNFNSGSTDTPTTISPTEENLPSVLTKQTKDSYEYLFSDSKEQVDKSDLTPKETGSILGEKPKSTTESSAASKEIKTTKDDKNLKLRDSSELRELAQVFSRALSAYLEDPDTFKEILAQVRPTEPNLSENSTPSPDDEVLDFSDGSQSRIGTTEQPGTTVSDIGEINNLASNKNIEDNSVEYSPDQSGNVFTTVAPENGTDYYKQGSSEDQSYFPTAGGVADSSRPRYGGFHNNTRNKYSPYGADVPKNTTGRPLAVSVTTPIPITTFGARITNVPEPQSVNSLANNIYNTGFTSSGEESYETNGSAEEKLLIASGSQSLVSSNNYVKFAEDFNKRNGYTKDTSATGSEDKDEGYLPYFGQEPPLENLAAPAAFQTQNPVLNETKDSEYRVSYKDVNLGNGVTLEKDVYTTNPTSFTPSFESTQYVSDYTTVGFSPTTYHPTVETASITTEPTQTETTPYWTTMKPDHPEYNTFMESKAKEMFGNLNESTVEALMEMMSQAESNMTIRRLVLLLASDKGKEYKTAAESRQSLINALLTDSTPEMTTPVPAAKRKVKTGKVKSNTRGGKSYRGTETATGNHGVESAELANKLNSAKLYIPTTATTTTTTESKLPYDSDARAVELLKTLYNLAAKWG